MKHIEEAEMVTSLLLFQVQEAVRRGPYLAKERQEAQPVVMTAERF